MTSSDANLPARETTGPRNGQATRPGSQALPGPNGSQPLVTDFEARVVTGKAGQALALEQAAAIREVIAWITRNRVPKRRRAHPRRHLTRSPLPGPEATSHDQASSSPAGCACYRPGGDPATAPAAELALTATPGSVTAAR